MPNRTFSFSRVQDYINCPQKYRWKNVVRITSKIKPKGLSMGLCMSRGLEGYRSGGTLDAAAEAFISAWKEDGENLKMEFDPEDEKDFRTVTRGIEILRNYIECYPDDPEQSVEPEVVFNDVEIGQIGDTTILLRGRIDGVMKVGGLCINEDKTASRLGPTYIPTLADSLQIKIYLWVADHLGLFRVGGKTSMPRCIMNVVKIHPKEFKMFRDITLKSRSTLEDAKETMLNWVRSILFSEETDNFPKANSDPEITCNRYGGCTFKGICFSSGSVREMLLKNEFVKREERK